MFSSEERVAVTVWSTVFVERLASAQQVKKFLTSYGTRILFNVFRKAVTGLFPGSPLPR
jgi:hypothetical protein